MIKTMKIVLSTEKADVCWGEKAIYSINNNVITLHIKDYNDLVSIQHAAQKINLLGIKQVVLFGKHWTINCCWAFWIGYRGSKNLYKIEWASNLDIIQRKELDNRLVIVDWVRDIINTPSEILGPEQLSERAVDLLCNVAGNKISYRMIKGNDLLEQKYFGLYTVGKGSARPPVLLILDYHPSIDHDKNMAVYACLVGKGITFDSGGYNIKQSSHMDSMKSDMGGAALVTGALALAISRGLNKRVKLWLCCADNLISGSSFKPGDIIHYRNGKSVEVMNTDAEGRLILADGLIDADMQKSEIIIDAATLTGAAQIALGNDYHAIFSFDDNLVDRLLVSASKENELFWRLPVTEFHRKQLSSDFAELSNIANVSYPAGASTAAGFLSHFVKNYQKGWLHIDCSANYHKNKIDQWSAGATGLGVLTIANLLNT